VGKLILQTEKECYLCRRPYPLDVHHVFAGARKNQSTKDGITVWLCRKCHKKVQEDADEMLSLQRHIQKRIMDEYGWTEEDFIERYGRSFINV